MEKCLEGGKRKGGREGRKGMGWREEEGRRKEKEGREGRGKEKEGKEGRMRRRERRGERKIRLLLSCQKVDLFHLPEVRRQAPCPFP